MAQDNLFSSLKQIERPLLTCVQEVYLDIKTILNKNLLLTMSTCAIYIVGLRANVEIEENVYAYPRSVFSLGCLLTSIDLGAF